MTTNYCAFCKTEETSRVPLVRTWINGKYQPGWICEACAGRYDYKELDFSSASKPTARLEGDLAPKPAVDQTALVEAIEALIEQVAGIRKVLERTQWH